MSQCGQDLGLHGVWIFDLVLGFFLPLVPGEHQVEVSHLFDDHFGTERAMRQVKIWRRMIESPHGHDQRLKADRLHGPDQMTGASLQPTRLGVLIPGMRTRSVDSSTNRSKCRSM